MDSRSTIAFAATLVANMLVAPGMARDVRIDAGLVRVAMDWTIIERGELSAKASTYRVSSPAPRRVVTYVAVHRAAERRGGYEPGERIVIAVCVDDATADDWVQTCELNGWTFCAQNREQQGLRRGIHQCEADEFGVLRFWDSFSAAGDPSRTRDVEARRRFKFENPPEVRPVPITRVVDDRWPNVFSAPASSQIGTAGWSGMGCTNGACSAEK